MSVAFTSNAVLQIVITRLKPRVQPIGTEDRNCIRNVRGLRTGLVELGGQLFDQDRRTRQDGAFSRICSNDSGVPQYFERLAADAQRFGIPPVLAQAARAAKPPNRRDGLEVARNGAN